MVTSAVDHKTMINISILGHVGCGKSSFIRTFIESSFAEDIPVTEVLQITHHELPDSVVAFWEYPYPTLRPLSDFLSQADGLIYLIDSSNPISERELEEDFDLISKKVASMDIPVAIGLTKSDLQVSPKLELSSILGLMKVVTDRFNSEFVRVFEISSKQLIGVEVCAKWIIENKKSSRQLDEDFDTIYSALLKLSDIGPEVIYSDFDTLPDPMVNSNTEEYLGNLGVSLSIALAQGNTFAEGIFELPAGYATQFRLLGISVRLHDSSLTDERHGNEGYGIFCFFISPRTLARFPRPVSVQDQILEELGRIEDLSGLSKEDFLRIKERILDIFSIGSQNNFENIQ